MPTITDHLTHARDFRQNAEAAPRHHYDKIISNLLISIDQLTEAVDLLHQQINKLNQQRKEKSA